MAVRNINKTGKCIIGSIAALLLVNPLSYGIKYVFDTEPTDIIIMTIPPKTDDGADTLTEITADTIVTDIEVDFSSDERSEPGMIVDSSELGESVTDEAAPSFADTVVQELRLKSVTTPVKNGSKATVSVKGKPNTEYTIKVTYKAVSKANGLEPRLSDSDGNVSWTWRVGVSTTPGEHPIEITGGGEVLLLSFVTYSDS